MAATKNPRVLVVTPEVTYLPDNMGNMSNYLSAKAGGLADVSAALIKALFEHGADVHVALPDYRALFNAQRKPVLGAALGSAWLSPPRVAVKAENRIICSHRQ